MSEIEVRAADLSGAALDWAVANANGFAVQVRPYAEFCNASTGHKVKVRYHRVWYEFDSDLEEYSPSADWAQCGFLIDKYRPDVQTNRDGQIAAYLNNSLSDTEPLAIGRGDAYLVAVCRAIVAARLGDTVQVPAELVEVAR